jgi:GcrA cell cycle regulator
MNATWTDTDISMLQRLWKEGHSASEIGKRMRRSRNAVMGKIHRLAVQEAAGGKLVKAPRANLQRPPAPPRKPKMKLVPPAPKPALPSVQLVDDSIVKPRPLLMKLFDLDNNDCRWPVEGEKANTLFCGHNTHEGKVYCAYHCRTAYAPREVKSERRAA